MEHNKEKLLLHVILFLLCAHFAFSQDSYSIDYSTGLPRFIQQLSWVRDEYAMNYEVVVQSINDDFNEYFFKGISELSAIEVSLSPGRYRFNVTPFDLLGVRGETSDWTEFEIIAAYQPVINRFFPHVFLMDVRVRRALYLDGDNLFEDSEIYLRSGRRNLIPINVDVRSPQRVVLLFDDEAIYTGRYDVYVRNPGGLVTSIPGFSIIYKKPLDLFIKLAYTPPIPLYGNLQEVFGTNLFLPGYNLSFEAVSSARGSFNGGIEFGVGSFFINPAAEIRFGMDNMVDGFRNAGDGAAIIDFDINIVMQTRFNLRRNAFSFRFGVGFTSLSGMGNFYNTEPLIVHFNLNASFMFLLYDIFFLDAGIDFTHYMGNDSFGLVKPRIGVVWQF